MNRALIDNIARAILYEGYVLYPYRPSVKTRQRWTFGGVYPRTWHENGNSSDAWTMQTQCLVETDVRSDAKIAVSVRFLHVIDRTVLDRNSQPLRSLEVAGKIYQPWQEAQERDLNVGEFSLRDLIVSPQRRPFSFPENRTVEALEDAGFLVREQFAITGEVEISAEQIDESLSRISVRIQNETPFAGQDRDGALMRSLVSTHSILTIENGQFISLTDPPEQFRDAASACRNLGAWPVLVGEEPTRDAILSSPIILYDYPQIAPESPGDLFDGTEIDEILTLRIMTLTDEEKRCAAGVDSRVRELLSRTDSLAREQLMNLHGTVRGMRPITQGAQE